MHPEVCLTQENPAADQRRGQIPETYGLVSEFKKPIAREGLHQESEMAKNTGDGFRRGAVSSRTQFQRPDGQWQKRDESTGHLMAVKQSDGPWKGVAKEPDGRDTPKSPENWDK